MISLAFITTALIVVLVPGTGVIYTVSTGITGNRRETVFAAVGCTLGIVPHLTAGVLGVSAVLHASAEIFQFIKILGVLYLLYLGFGLIRKGSAIALEGKKNEQGGAKIIGRAVLLNLLNPKLTLFFCSFLPQFIDRSGSSQTAQMLLLSAVFMLLTLIVFLLYGLLANYFKQLFVKSPRIISRIQKGFGCLLIGFAAKLALDDD